jgi:hypothetical protein
MKRLLSCVAAVAAMACSSAAVPPPEEPVHSAQEPSYVVEPPVPEPLAPGSIPETPSADPARRALPMPMTGLLELPKSFAAQGSPGTAPDGDPLKFSAELPEGWLAFECQTAICKLSIVQRAWLARILLLPLVPAEESALQAVKKLGDEYEKEMPGQVKAGKAVPLADSDCATASLTYSKASGNGDKEGAIGICLIGPKKEYLVVYMGGWPKKHTANVLPDFAALLRSTKLEAPTAR